MRVLLVEDEKHKQEELAAFLSQHFGSDVEVTRSDSVHAAYWAVNTEDFDLIVLDMALPTFSADDGAEMRGNDQALGGIEVLRALKARGTCLRVVVVSQYPVISVGGKQLDLDDAASVLSKRYSQNVIGGVIYKYGSKSHFPKLTRLLKGSS